METKPTNQEALTIFLTEVFKNKMKEGGFNTVMLAEEKDFYFKLWQNGVQSGMELNRAIQDLKERDI